MILLSNLKQRLDKSPLKILLYLIPILSLLIFSLTLVLRGNVKPQDYSSCGTVLHHGQWIKNYTHADPENWQPQDCTLHPYETKDLIQCMKPGSQLLFLGDSTARMIFWATANLLDSGIRADFNVHGNIEFVRHNITIKLLWDPYLNKSESFGLVKQIARNSSLAGSVHYVYITTGLWHAMFERRDRVLIGFKKSMDDMAAVLKNAVPGAFGNVYWGPTQLPLYSKLDKSRNKKITAEYIEPMLDYTHSIFGYNYSNHASEHGNEGILYTNDSRPAAYYTPVFNRYGPGHLTVYDHIGLHYLPSVIALQTQTLLNHHCNGRIMKPDRIPHDTTCCVPYDQPTSTHLSLIALTAALGVILVLFMVISSQRLASIKSTVAIVMITVLTALYAYLCDRTHQTNQQFLVLSWYELGALLQVLVITAVLSVSRANFTLPKYSSFVGHPVLISEWKGICVSLWLICMFTGLNKEYFQAHILRRILEASLIFSETYGFALSTMAGDVGIFNVVSQMFRLNVLAVLLAWTLDTSYYFYSMPAKISFWYVFVFAGFGILQPSTISKIVEKVLPNANNSPSNHGYPSVTHNLVRLCLVTLAFGFGVVVFWTPFSEGVLRFPVDLKDEFWVGVVAVALSAVVSDVPLCNSIAQKLADVKSLRTGILLAVFFVTTLLVNIYFLNGSFLYINQYLRTYHQIATIGFVFVYLVLRACLLNFTAIESTTAFLFYYSGVLEFLGSCWLEMFVLSFHGLLAGDGTSRLYFLTTGTTDDTPMQLNSRRLVNFLFVFGFFLILSQRISSSWEGLGSIVRGGRKTTPSSAVGNASGVSPYTLELYEFEDQQNSKAKTEDGVVTLTTPASSSSMSSCDSSGVVETVQTDKLS